MAGWWRASQSFLSSLWINQHHTGMMMQWHPWIPRSAWKCSSKSRFSHFASFLLEHFRFKMLIEIYIFYNSSSQSEMTFELKLKIIPGRCAWLCSVMCVCVCVTVCVYLWFFVLLIWDYVLLIWWLFWINYFEFLMFIWWLLAFPLPCLRRQRRRRGPCPQALLRCCCVGNRDQRYCYGAAAASLNSPAAREPQRPPGNIRPLLPRCCYGR